MGLGTSWARFWKGLGGSWTPLGRFLGALGAFKNHFFTILTQDHLQDAPRWPQDWILMPQDGPKTGFWDGFGRVWAAFGLQFEGLVWGTLLGSQLSFSVLLGRLLCTLCVCCCVTFYYRTPRAASLRPAERHNTRGVSNPSACWMSLLEIS